MFLLWSFQMKVTSFFLLFFCFFSKNKCICFRLKPQWLVWWGSVRHSCPATSYHPGLFQGYICRLWFTWPEFSAAVTLTFLPVTLCSDFVSLLMFHSLFSISGLSFLSLNYYCSRQVTFIFLSLHVLPNRILFICHSLVLLCHSMI